MNSKLTPAAINTMIGIFALILVLGFAAYCYLVLVKPTAAPAEEQLYSTQVIDKEMKNRGVFDKTVLLVSPPQAKDSVLRYRPEDLGKTGDITKAE